MAINPEIALQAKAPDSLTNLSNLAGTANNLLSLQRGKATLLSDIAKSKAESNLAQTTANVAEQTAQPRIAEQQAITSQQQTAANRANTQYTAEMHQRVQDQITGLIGDESIRTGDSKGIDSVLSQAEQNALAYAANPEDTKKAFEHLRQVNSANPKMVLPTLVNFLRQSLGAGQQASVIQPNGPTFNTGQQQVQVNTNPLSAQPQGVVAGVTNQIPTGTQAYDPNSGKPYLMGPGGAGVQSGPALGEQANVEGNVAVVNKDFTDTQENAKNANNAISILQNIKKYSHGAATGVGGVLGAASIASDLARITGLSEGDVKTNTDLLAKNANMLALAGGDTNLARTLAEAANPNTHMSPEAIRLASDQVMSIHQMNLAKQKFLNQYKGDPTQYLQKLQQFNSIADPRVWQFPGMSKADRAHMKASMSPQEQQAFGQSLQQAESLGLVK